MSLQELVQIMRESQKNQSESSHEEPRYPSDIPSEYSQEFPVRIEP
jgi:hypothetical protein